MAKREVIIELQFQDGDAVNKLGRLEIETKQYQRELRTLNAEIAKNGNATAEQTRRVAELSAMIRRNQGVTRELKNDLSGLTAAGLRFRDKMAQASTQALQAFGLNVLTVTGAVTALVGVFGSAGRAVANFDAAQSNLAAILNTNKQGIALLTEEAKRYGSTTQFTASQVSELQTELAKLGFTQTQISQATPAVLSLAAATGTSLGNAATIAAQTLNAFGLSAAETGRIVDVIAQSANLSAFDIDTFGAAMSNAATAAKAVGVSVEETSALLSVLVDAGIPAEKAGTDLRNIFISLSAEGMTMDEAFAEIRQSTDGLTTATKLFGERSGSAGIILADNTEKIARLKDGYDNAAGAAANMAETQLDNLKGDKLLLQSAWEGFVLSVEDGSGIIAKSLRAVYTMLAQILEGLTSVSNVQLESFTSEVEKAAAAATDMRDIQLDSTAAQEILEQYQRQTDALKEYGSSQSEILLQEDELAKLRQRLAELTRKLPSGQELSAQGKIEREAVRVAIQRYEASIAAAKAESALNETKRQAAEIDAEVVAKAGSVAARRAELTKEIEAQKKAREDLAVTDAAGIALADATIAKLQAQLKALDPLTEKERELLNIRRQAQAARAEGPLGMETPLNVGDGAAPVQDAASRQLLDNTAYVNAEIAALNEEEARLFIEAQEAKMESIAALSNAIGGVAQLMGEQTAAGKAFATAQALINTYLGVTQILANATALPEPAATIQKTAAIAANIATGLAAVRRIQGFEEGGYTSKKASNHEPVGVVHANEWVAPAWMVKSPAFAPILGQLEDFRKMRGLTSMTDGFFLGGRTTRGTALVNSRREPSVPGAVITSADLARAIRGINMQPVVRVTDIIDTMGSVVRVNQASAL